MNNNELVVISGKGGTGKTSLVASFATLAKKVVLADCDVDAADLHLILQPKVIRSESFSGGSRARILSGTCFACGKCMEVCRFDAISYDGPGNDRVEKTPRVNPIACDGCGVCVWFCAENAIVFGPVENGNWFVSETRCGPMVHAELGVAEENSGKLVSIVRTEAKRIAVERGIDTIIIDGSPGIGCPVIASITGANLVLVVTEPTLSGLHDLERVVRLTRHFKIPIIVCINKHDLNTDMTSEIERKCAEKGVEVAGRIRYSGEVTEAMIQSKSITEYANNQVAEDIRQVWEFTRERLMNGRE